MNSPGLLIPSHGSFLQATEKVSIGLGLETEQGVIRSSRCLLPSPWAPAIYTLSGRPPGCRQQDGLPLDW